MFQCLPVAFLNNQPLVIILCMFIFVIDTHVCTCMYLHSSHLSPSLLAILFNLIIGVFPMASKDEDKTDVATFSGSALDKVQKTKKNLKIIHRLVHLCMYM